MFISNIPKMGFNLNEVPKELRDSALEARGDRGTGAPASRCDLKSEAPASTCDLGSDALASRCDL